MCLTVRSSLQLCRCFVAGTVDGVSDRHWQPGPHPGAHLRVADLRRLRTSSDVRVCVRGVAADSRSLSPVLPSSAAVQRHTIPPSP